MSFTNITLPLPLTDLQFAAPQLFGAVVEDDLQMNDFIEPPIVPQGTGKIYKKTGDDGLYWKPSGSVEVDLTDGSGPVEYSLTDSAAVTWVLDTQQVGTIQLTSANASRTLTVTNIQAGGTYILRIKQDGTTPGRTIIWDTPFKWPGGVAPTLSTVVDSIDIITFTADVTDMYGVANLAFA